jgi:hypothetical protein
MRSIILLSALSLLAACNDGATTSPSSNRPSAPSAARADVNKDYPPGPSGSGKPLSGPTITIVESFNAHMAGAGNVVGFPSTGTLTKTCPVGTQLIGGGFNIYGGIVTDLHVNSSVPDGANGWKVNVTETGDWNSSAYFTVTAICIS